MQHNVFAQEAYCTPLLIYMNLCAEAGVISGAGGLIRSHLKQTPVTPKASHDRLVRIRGEWSGAVHVGGWNTFKIQT